MEISWVFFSFISFIACMLVIFGQEYFKTSEAKLIEKTNGNYGRLGLDVNFVHDFHLWTKGTIETIYYALEILSYFDSALARQHANKCIDSITSCFNVEKGGALSTKFSPNIQATHCALACLKTAYGLPIKEPLTKEIKGLSNYNRDQLISYARKLINQHAKKCYIADIYSATSILWNMGAELATREHDIILALIKKLENQNDGGYLLRISDKESCISACYFIAKLLQHLPGQNTEHINKERLAGFIKSCQSSDGLFSGRPGLKSNVLHTRFAIQINSMLELNLSMNYENIFSSIKKCKNDYGISFAQGLTPNIYALANALEIVREYAVFEIDEEILDQNKDDADRALAKIDYDINSVISLLMKFYIRKPNILNKYKERFLGYPNLPLLEKIV